MRGIWRWLDVHDGHHHGDHDDDPDDDDDDNDDEDGDADTDDDIEEYDAVIAAGGSELAQGIFGIRFACSESLATVKIHSAIIIIIGDGTQKLHIDTTKVPADFGEAL